MTYTEDEIASAYTYYGIQLTNVESKNIAGTLEDLVVSVIENPPFARAVSLLPALLIKNAHILDIQELVRRAKTNDHASAKLGYIFEVTTKAIKKLEQCPEYVAFEQALSSASDGLECLETPLVWITQKAIRFYGDDLRPTQEEEKKWGVITKFDQTEYDRHVITYVHHE